MRDNRYGRVHLRSPTRMRQSEVTRGVISAGPREDGRLTPNRLRPPLL